jgi:hypothetical protein
MSLPGLHMLAAVVTSSLYGKVVFIEGQVIPGRDAESAEAATRT